MTVLNLGMLVIVGGNLIARPRDDTLIGVEQLIHLIGVKHVFVGLIVALQVIDILQIADVFVATCQTRLWQLFFQEVIQLSRCIQLLALAQCINQPAGVGNVDIH